MMINFMPCLGRLLLVFSLSCVLTNAEAQGEAVDGNEVATARWYAKTLAQGEGATAALTMFSQQLPKGGDLHHHYSGAQYAETYLKWVQDEHFCVYRRSDATLGIEAYRIETQPEILSVEKRRECLSAEAIYADSQFYGALLATWSDKDFDNHYHLQTAPDLHFFDTFRYFGPVAGKHYGEGLRLLKERALAENVGYLETMFRSAPFKRNPEIDQLLNTLPPEASDGQVSAALAVAAKLLAEDPAQTQMVDAYVAQLAEAATGLDDARFRLRFQSYVGRNNSPAQVFAGLYSAFLAASRSPLIVGVNFVSPENGVVSMRDYRLHMRMFAFLRQAFPHVPLALHAGELTLGMVPPEGLKNHIREAVRVAKAERIGHGVDIAYESDAPALLRQMAHSHVAVEINLTSNAFILGVKGGEHPLGLYRAFGVPFVIATDDAGVSRNDLSAEYQRYMQRYRPSYRELKMTVYNSIRYAFLPAVDKADELKRLAERFRQFEAQVAKWPVSNF